MIQRKTLHNGIKDEKEAINYYINLIHLSKTQEEKELYTQILNQERRHKEILEHQLKIFTEKKGQTTISNLLQI